MAHHDDAAGEILQVFLQDLQCLNIEVVRRLIEHEEVRILHQHRAEIELTALSPTELINIVLLLLGCEHEIVEKLRGSHLPSTTQVDIIGDICNDVDDFLILIKLQSVLREIAELHSLSDIELATVGWHDTEKHLNERRLSRTVVSHDAHLLETREVVIEVIEDNFIVPLGVGELLRDILTLEDL